MNGMTAFGRKSLGIAAAVVALMAMLCAAGANSAWADDGDLCVPVHGKIRSLFVADGCASPVGLCTTGVITEGGMVNGTTEFTALAIAPAAGMPGTEPDTTLSYSGLLNIATLHGAITVRDAGIFDTARGVFSELDRIVEGTGRFAGSSGTLFISGPAFADGSGFSGDIRGEICLVR